MRDPLIKAGFDRTVHSGQTYGDFPTCCSQDTLAPMKRVLRNDYALWFFLRLHIATI